MDQQGGGEAWPDGWGSARVKCAKFRVSQVVARTAALCARFQMYIILCIRDYDTIASSSSGSLHRGNCALTTTVLQL